MLYADCRAIQERFADHIDRTLPLPARREVDAHLEGCAACRNALAMSRALVSALAEVPAPELPEGYGARLSARLEAAPASRPLASVPGRRRRRPALLPAGGRARALAGLAASVLLVTVFLLHGGREAARSPLPSVPDAPLATAADGVEPVHLAMGAEATVEIWFDAERPVDGVRFAIELPPGVRLLSNGQPVAMGHLEWEGSLAEGRNVLSFPVRGVTRGRWTVTTSVENEVGRREKSIDLLVNGV